MSTNDELTQQVAAQLYVQNAVDWAGHDLGEAENLAKLCWRSAAIFVAAKDKAGEPAYIKNSEAPCPTAAPTPAPTAAPTAAPTPAPTTKPTAAPTPAPRESNTEWPKVPNPGQAEPTVAPAPPRPPSSSDV